MTEQNPYDQLRSPLLTGLGFNLQAVFSVHQLPQSVRETFPQELMSDNKHYSLLMIGHGGKRFWQGFMNQTRHTTERSSNPIDDYSIEVADHFMQQRWPELSYHVLYPGPNPVGLQQLGVLAGWYHSSPLKVGINATWGLWYAYRVVLLVEGVLEPTEKVQQPSPCDSCMDKPCITACPGQALSDAGRMLTLCVDHRLQPESSCQNTCVARQACPIQLQHRYDPDQIHYHYQRSYQTIQSFCV